MTDNYFFKPLPRLFYLRPTLQVAHDLLGRYFVRRLGRKTLIGKIVEVEAYRKNDPASHSFRGRTQRNDVMFWTGGHLYVYFTYGMHFCANIVTGNEGIGEAVLIRAVEPLAGIEIMTKNRFPDLQSHNHQSLINLTNGPAKFCQAFGIARKENGADLFRSDIFIIDTEVEGTPKISAPEVHAPSAHNHQSPITNLHIGRSPRIGIQQGLEKKWRFFIKGNPWVSK